jgi:glutathione S-transferase
MSAWSIGYNLSLAGSMMTTFMRGGLGTTAGEVAERPGWLFELYEFEACPYCRIVREALTELDLDATIYPCPKGGERFRPRVVERGGKAQFPYLVDPNTGRALYESKDIVEYLYETYGKRRPPFYWQWMELQQLGSSLAGAPRLGAGLRAAPSKAPEKPLQLYSFEASPFARPVRERLCELEIPYVLRSCGRRTAADWVPPQARRALYPDYEPSTVNRRALLERAGRVTIPYLMDPNTGVQMGESAEILDYLETTYAA